jgi:hypothetical protein
LLSLRVVYPWIGKLFLYQDQVLTGTNASSDLMTFLPAASEEGSGSPLVPERELSQWT